jgi:RNA polymerase sigma factor (sigma-70 family)
MRSFTSQFIRQVAATPDQRTDGDLLDGFLNQHVEVDFAELVRRYCSMVWGVCRRNLPDHADAEDAFQTVFLVLVRRGKKLIGVPTIGPWLHRVAVWTTRNVRRRNAHRLSRHVAVNEDLPADSRDRDLSLDLDSALLALPEKFRSSIVLCHLMGFSRADAAAQLGCREGTLSAWLSRGLARLRKKLGDLDPTRTLGIAALAPAGLSVSVVRAATAINATAATAALSSSLHPLVEGVLRMFWVKKATAASVALFATFAFGVGVGVSTHQLAPVAGGQDKATLQKTGSAPASPKGLNAPGTGGFEIVRKDEQQLLASRRIVWDNDVTDSDTIVKKLETQLEKTEQEFKATMEWVKRAKDKVVQNTHAVVEQKLDRKELENALDDLAKAQAQAKELSLFRDKVKEAISQMKELAPAPKAKLNPKEPSESTVPKKVETLAPPANDDLDKKLAERIKRLAEMKKLLIEKREEGAKLEDEIQDLGRRVKDLEHTISDLQKKKSASPSPPKQ